MLLKYYKNSEPAVVIILVLLKLNKLSWKKNAVKTVFIIVSFAISRRTSSWEALNNKGSQSKKSRKSERGGKKCLTKLNLEKYILF